jgi:hypothetical protein
MNRHFVALIITTAAAIGLAPVRNGRAESPAPSNQEPRWEADFWSRDLDRDPTAFTVWDDGSGVALYAVGRFQRANGLLVRGFARWDGIDWSPIGDPSGCWGAGGAFAVAVFDDGAGAALYAGGVSVDAQGIGRPMVAKWDGSTWSEIGTLSNPAPHTQVNALAVYDDGSGAGLYATGGFDTADGSQVDHIAKWTGSVWLPLAGSSGTGLEHAAQALETYDDGTGNALYVGGYFSSAGGVTVNSLARWDGAEWTAISDPLGLGTYDSVKALEVWDDGSGEALYVGGTFNDLGSLFPNHVVKWDGSAWSTLTGSFGTGVAGGYSIVDSLAVHDGGSGPKLFVGGDFQAAGGIEALNIACWDGAEWSPLTGPTGNGVSDAVAELISFDDGGGARLYAGGDFDLAGGLPVGKIASWDAASWSHLSTETGHGLGSSALALEVYDSGSGPEVVAGGYFRAAGDLPASSVARWNGSSWSTLEGPSGEGILGEVHALEVWDRGSGPELYVGGGFSAAGGLSVKNIVRWDGGGWSELVGSSSQWAGGRIRELLAHDDGNGTSLFAAGGFTQISGVVAHRIARWNGVSWQSLIGSSGEGLDARADDLVAFDDGNGQALYVGGFFETAGGVTVNGVARWDGFDWSALAGPTGTGVEPDTAVLALAVYDDGGGVDLYAGGFFDTAGGVAAKGVARWDGADWSPVGGPTGYGVDGEVWSMAVWEDGNGPALYVSGLFTTAGGVNARNIARWDGATWSALEGPAGNGIDWAALALHGFENGRGPGLAAAGYLNSAGGLASDRFAVWRQPTTLVFDDGFESGDLSAWSVASP